MTFVLLAAMCLGLVYGVSAYPGGGNQEEGVDEGLKQSPPEVRAPPASPAASRQKRSSCSVLADDIPPNEWQQYMVDGHNRRRRNEVNEYNSSNVNKLTYDVELAKMSQFRANKCIWEHGDYTDCNGNAVGQNMYYIGQTGAFPINSNIAELALTGWYDNEKPHYDLNKTECAAGEVCGHYTQVIWAATERVGCGAKICDELFKYNESGHVVPYRDAHDYTLVICDYSPPGNYVGQKPYSQGGVCSACKGDNGVSCYNDTLCTKCNHIMDVDCECPNEGRCNENGGDIDESVDHCSCINCPDGKGGEACEIDCDKKSGDAQAPSSCNYWKDCGFCASSSVYSAFMQQNCKDTCAC